MRDVWVAVFLAFTCWTGEVMGQETQPAQWVTTLEEVFLAGVSEGTPINTVLGTLLAVDPLGSSVIYGTNSNIVTVHGITGEVTLTAELDREAVSMHMVTFFAYNNIQAPVTVALVVLDENDNAPQFVSAPYTTTISEALQTGMMVFDGIVATDIDAGKNAELSISCIVPTDDLEAEEACRTFQFSLQRMSEGQYRGMVFLNRALSYDYKNEYELYLRIADFGDDAYETNTTLTINVARAIPNIIPPIFLNSPLSFSVFENRNAEVSVFELQVRSSNPADTVSLIIIIEPSSDPRNLFSVGETINRENGLYVAPIYVTGELDRETINDFYVFSVQAIERIAGLDEDQIAETSVTVTVLDVNDNHPVISLSSNTISVPEDLSRNSVVPGFSIVVTDTDVGDNAFFEVSLAGDSSSSFSLSPNVATQRAEISLILTGFLDYDNIQSRTLELQVIALETETAEQRSTRQSFTVNVQDSNDNVPQFSISINTVYLRENRPVGSSVATITATDADSGEFGFITYSLAGQFAYLLSVNNITGSTYLAEPLDFETLQSFTVEFIATDGGGLSSSTQLEVQVIDFNDEAPVFVADEYRAFTDESSTVLVPPITVQATDSESDEDITYSIVAGNIGNAFYVDPNLGTLRLLRPISYEATNEGIITLTVEASDNGEVPQKSTVPVIITVRDANNHAPVFRATIHRKTILETDRAGTMIAQLEATDADSGTNGRVSYILHSGSQDNFVVNPTSGMMTVAPNADLDIDVYGEFYDIIVYGVDQGSPQKTGQVRVFVTVEDVNNKIPDFAQDLYTFTVIETVSSGTNVGNVQAFDPDKGSSIQYSIDIATITARDRSGQVVTSTQPIDYMTLFRVDPLTGTIYTDGALDRDHVAEVSFDILATDQNGVTPRVQVGSAVVIITIRSTVDDGLSFNPPWTSQNPNIELVIAEEEPVGTLITTIIAHDPETGNQVLDYRKVPGSDPLNFFVVIQETGQVYLNKRMDFEDSVTSQKTFRLEAFTAPPESRSAMATITVRTQDINDHDPEFKLTQYNFAASEGLRPGDQIGVVVATDEDSDEFGRVTFSLSGPGSDLFNIHPDWGYIEIKDNRSLDREWVPEFYLLVRATDQGGRYAEVPLTIAVLDENDNVPQFSSPEYNMYTSEYVPPYSSLGQVHAIDQDAGANGVITYRIINGNDLGFFDIDTSTGIVRPVADLQGYARDFPYTLTVEAADGGSEPSKSTTVIQVHVTQVENQDGRPQIEFPPEDGLQIDIPEDATIGTNITQILASDSDLGPEGELEYGFVPNDALNEDHSKFHIDPDTGLITISQDLDRETKEQYELLVYVKDRGSPPNQVTRTIIVTVTDINDNRPTFANSDGCPELELQRPMYATVEEESDAGTYVATVAACDADSPPNNIVYYFIVCGNSYPDTEIPPYDINILTGVITTAVVLDYEVVPTYDLCVYASNVNTPPVTRRKRAVIDENSDSVQHVLITVGDINDNGPVFPTPSGSTSNTIVTGLASGLSYGSPVIQMQATDPDGNSDYTYMIDNIMFVSHSQERQAVSIAHFLIDRNSGLVSTGWEDYDRYVGGSFELIIIATDSQDRTAESKLIVYVLSSNQRSKFTFNHPPEVVQTWYQAFLGELDGYLDKDTKINADSLRYAIDVEGKALYNGTDICFHMVQNNQVMDQREAQRLLETLEQDNRAVELLFSRYSVVKIDACEPHVTTKWWSGWWWLWWLLVALALFIILVTFIVICVICCCWPKHKKDWTYYPYDKPYVILDHVNAMPPHYGYEWQEQVVRMN